MPDSPNKLVQFWNELKRRRVIHVTIVYSTAGFIIIELVNNVTEPLNLPGWTPTFVIILLLIGFPLALIFSWIFDITPEGLEKTKPETEIKEEAVATDLAHRKKTRNWGSVINWSLMGLLVLMVATYIIIRYSKTTEPLPVQRFIYNIPQGKLLGSSRESSVVTISPDGSKLVYVSHSGDTSSLVLRNLDQFEAHIIPGTEGAASPFFSPDGIWVGYFAGGNLMKVSLLGGAPLTICEARTGFDGCWGEDHAIIYADGYNRGLMRVLESGGDPEQITSSLTYTKEESDQQHTHPQILPGGNVILYTVVNNSQDLSIAAYSIETGKKWNLIEHGSNGIYVRSGHLVYAWKGDVMAAPFNLKQMKVTGDPVSVLEGVMMDAWSFAQISISEEGSLVYVPGNIMEQNSKPVLADGQGEIRTLDLPAGRYQSPRFSPDGERFLITKLEEKANTWIYDMERGTFHRFTEKEYETFWAIWTPDSKGIVFNSNLYGGPALNLFHQLTNSTDPPVRLTTSNFHQLPKSWSVDGRSLIFTEGIHPDRGADINLLQMEGDTVSQPFINTSFNETQPTISPDGRWLAYVSDHQGREEVFVCSFPGRQEMTQVSIQGGVEPVWAPDGKEIYYRDVTGDHVMAVPMNLTSGLQLGKPSILLEGEFKQSTGPWGRNYDITPDGQWFLMINEGENESAATHIHIVLNWFEDLKRLAPPGD